jgi:citronellol/citronellal dehydrogenase
VAASSTLVVVTTHGLYGIAHTIAARSGAIGLSRAVAVEWVPLNIRVNCIAPGAIETEGWAIYTPEARAAYPRSNPMMRAGTAWDCLPPHLGHLALRRQP